MKVGILTFHRAYNYGAILQAYALQSKIREFGNESEVIDYISNEKARQIKLFSYVPEIGVKNNIIKFLKDIYRYKKNKNFDYFMSSEMKISSDRYSSFDEMKKMDKRNVYDAYVVGSDQVWNTKNNKKDETFLLSFVENNSKRCSYAASFGSTILDKEMRSLYQNELKKFRVLSVREKSGIKQNSFLKDFGTSVDIDPTLLLKKEDYIRIASPRIVRKKYAFLYTIEEDKNLRKYAQRFCKENNLILVDSKRSRIFFKNSSPKDYLSFFYNAEYIFTNSFHGTAFSLIFHKQFVTEVNTKHRLNNRSRDLLIEFNLLDRDMDSKNHDIKRTINPIDVEKVADRLRSESCKSLQEILKV